MFVLDLIHGVGGNSSIFPRQLFLRYCSFSAVGFVVAVVGFFVVVVIAVMLIVCSV